MTQPIKYANVADIYDSYVQTTLDIPFLLDQVKGTSSEVLELMSGTGRISLPLIEAGATLTCVDKSPEMLAILEKKLTQNRRVYTAHLSAVQRFSNTQSEAIMHP
ncbi:MAG: class I SAM-dependent methyltransferase [Cyanobacteria bacterium P01_F01_bin.13]